MGIVLTMGCLFQRGNQVWYGAFCMNGKRVWRSTGTKVKDEAQLRYAEFTRQYISWGGLTIQALHDHLIETFLPGSVAPSTIALYSQALNQFSMILGNLRLKDVSPYHVELFKSKRLKSVSPVKVSIDFRTLRAAFGRAVNLKMLDINPFRDCQDVQIPPVKPYFMSKQEVDVLLENIPERWFRDLVIITLCTSMRVGEMVHLRWESVDFKREVVDLENSGDYFLKTRMPRTIPLNRIALEILRQLPHSSVYVFPNEQGNMLPERRVSRKFKRYVRKAGLSDRIHYHSLRHTGASWLVQSGVPITFVKEILGHSNIQTTMIYAHSTIDHLRESVHRLDKYVFS